MTAQVLIDAHNLHHYHAWFDAARRAMREKRFERFAEFHRARFAEEEDPAE
jgi:queuine/archaeosine tRNA-ribosyltransferase